MIFGGHFDLIFMIQCVCVYSNSRNDVPRVAQRYGTIAAHTRRHASVLIVFVVFCVHMHSFAGLIRRTPPRTFSDTAITDRHSDTTVFLLRAHWVRISWSIGSEKSFEHVPAVGVKLMIQSVCLAYIHVWWVEPICIWPKNIEGWSLQPTFNILMYFILPAASWKQLWSIQKYCLCQHWHRPKLPLKFSGLALRYKSHYVTTCIQVQSNIPQNFCCLLQCCR